MTVYYLDASAWVKRYFLEPGSRWIQQLFRSHQAMAASPLCYVEVAASLARQSANRPTTPPSEVDLRNAFEAHWQELIKVEIDDAVFQRARSLTWDLRLRGADSIHLATADSLRTRLALRSVSLTLLTSDLELIAAAGPLGISIQNPIDQE